MKKRDLFFWLAFTLVQLCIFISLSPYVETDTWSYHVSPFVIQPARTPVYPFILWLCSFAGPWADALLCWLQFGFSFASLLVLYKALCVLGLSRRFARAAIFLYSINIAVFPWNSILLTESFSLSFTGFYIYFCALLTCSPRQKRFYLPQVLGIHVLTLLMIFLRPTFVVLIPISCFLSIYAAVQRKILSWQKIAVSLAACLVTTGCVLGYSAGVAQKSGYFTLSTILTSQQYSQAIDQGFHRTIPPNEITRYIQQNEADGASLRIGYELVSLYPADQVKQTLNDMLRANFPAYLSGRIAAYGEASTLPFGRRPHYGQSAAALPGILLSGLSYLLFPPLPFSFAAPLCLAGLAAVLFLWLRRKYFDIILFGCSGYGLFTVASSIFGTVADYARTAISCFPFLFVLILRLLLVLRQEAKSRTGAAQEAVFSR